MSHLESNAGAHASYSANRVLLVVAAVLLAIPVVALLWVDSYARINPTLAGFPFFI